MFDVAIVYEELILPRNKEVSMQVRKLIESYSLE
jgi:hypothetical protein